jgi:hypothetical protein
MNTNKASGTFSIVSWNETTKKEAENQKLTVASVEYRLDGGLNGRLSVEYSMFYTEFNPADVHAGRAGFSGTLWFEGELNGLKGSFGAMDGGEFAAGEVRSGFAILDGSGRGELAGIRGGGTYSAGPAGMNIEVGYEIGS